MGSVLGFIGTLGGISGAIYTIFAGSINWIVTRQFIAAILKETYQVQKYEVDSSEYYEAIKHPRSLKTYKSLSEKEGDNETAVDMR